MASTPQINLIGSKQGPTGPTGIWVNPSWDPSGQNQLHVHNHPNGQTISLYKNGVATHRTTLPPKP